MTPSIQPPPPQPEYLTRLLAHCHKRKYLAKTEIIRPGDKADVLLYILEGSVTALMEDEEGREIVLAYLNKGDYVGEMGIYLPTPIRSASIKTRSDCLIAEISYTKLEHLMDGELKAYAKEILGSIGRQLSTRLLQTSRKVGHLAFYDVTGRVARTLLELCQEPDAITHPDGMQIKITRQEMGRIVGCSREMVSRVLKNLEEQGLVEVKGKTIVVFGTR
jgi:CRP/FNR family cyclic AMP-dependent transcriptional regulator